jgi:acyl-coenzyme A synthetase/AMP-(fatty) acid ligase
MKDNVKKRAVICTSDPERWIPQLSDYSIMIVNPTSTPARKKYLLDRADWSLLIDQQGEHYRNGSDYVNEKVLWYTSGTTEDSKFCSFSQQQIDIMADKICQTYNITANDRYTSIMNLWHAHGQGFYWATQRAGCETNYIAVKDIRTISNFNPTFITAIPDLLKAVRELPLNDLRFIRSASSPLPDSLYTELKNKFSVPIIEAFGMTEALSHCFTNPLDGEQRIGTIGLPDGIAVDIVENKLFIKGPTVCSTGWYDTGDLADQDSAGYYRILGRSRDQINVRGYKLNPVSLENQLRKSLREITDCVIFGQDQIKCLYVGNCDPTTITKFLTGLGPQCRPTMVKPVDTIPLSPSGKVSRSYLDTQFN